MSEKKKKEADDAYLKLTKKIQELSDNIAEEFDLMELVEDSIKDTFSCKLDCSNCSREEMGKCMQGFKKANLFWLRKIVQDENMLKKVVEQMDELYNEISEYAKEIKNAKKGLKHKEEEIKENFYI